MNQQKITIKNKHNESLAGDLEGSVSDKIIIICHGLADTKDNPAFVLLAKKLCEQTSVPTFRFDFSGNGQSEGQFVDATYHKEVDDLLCVLDYFVTLGVKKICLIGHSMGGGVCQVVSGMNAHESTKNITTLVSLAGVSRAESFRDKYPELVNTIERDGVGYIWQERFGEKYPLTKTYLESAKTIDILSYAQNVRCPTLALQGDEDTRIRAEHTKEYLAKIPKERATKFSFVHMNHGFNRHKGPKAMEDAVDEIVFEIAVWLENVF